MHSSRSFNRRPTSSSMIGTLIVGSIVIATVFMLSGRAAKFSAAELEWEKHREHYEKTNEWNFAVISDMDTNSKVEVEGDHPYWRSFLQKAKLYRDKHTGRYSVKWEQKHEVKTVLNEKGRAMELSDLTFYNNMLLACDDRTGIVYEIVDHETAAKAYPRFILMDGDGDSAKGYKCEWGTVKDDVLYIGSFGKEFTTNSGEILNQNPMWVKTLNSEGVIDHVNWTKVYLSLREASGTQHPGYLFHESAHWNPILKRWFFLPRRVSEEAYDPVEDERRGSNLVISTNENFEDIQVNRIGNIIFPTRGFSCFRFIPGRRDEILAIKSEEVGLNTASYILVFNLKGEILLDESLFVEGIKFEGLEFLHDL